MNFYLMSYEIPFIRSLNINSIEICFKHFIIGNGIHTHTHTHIPYSTLSKKQLVFLTGNTLHIWRVITFNWKAATNASTIIISDEKPDALQMMLEEDFHGWTYLFFNECNGYVNKLCVDLVHTHTTYTDW